MNKLFFDQFDSRVGVIGILFFVLSAQAPLTGIAGALPLAIGMGNGAGAPAAYLVVGVVIALFAVGFYYVVRGGVSVVVAGVIGQLWSAVPLYLAEAVLVELAAAFLLSPARGRRQGRALTFGVVSGLLIGTVEFA